MKLKLLLLVLFITGIASIFSLGRISTLTTEKLSQNQRSLVDASSLLKSSMSSIEGASHLLAEQQGILISDKAATLTQLKKELTAVKKIGLQQTALYKAIKGNQDVEPALKGMQKEYQTLINSDQALYKKKINQLTLKEQLLKQKKILAHDGLTLSRQLESIAGKLSFKYKRLQRNAKKALRKLNKLTLANNTDPLETTQASTQATKQLKKTVSALVTSKIAKSTQRVNEVLRRVDKIILITERIANETDASLLQSLIKNEYEQQVNFVNKSLVKIEKDLANEASLLKQFNVSKQLYQKIISTVNTEKNPTSLIKNRQALNKANQALSQAVIALGKSSSSFLKKLDSIASAIDRYSDKTALTANKVATQSQQSIWRSGTSFFFLFLFIGAIVVYQVMKIVKNSTRFHRISRTIKSITQGELNNPIDDENMGDLTELVVDVNSLNTTLLDIASGIQNKVDLVAGGVKDIHQGNEDLSQRTHNQADALSHAADELKSLTSILQNSAVEATEANHSMRQASEQTTAGVKLIRDMSSAIEEINNSNKQIIKFIEVIDTISMQTTLLAVNAAAEASRAGSEGAGFSVVAAEVRALSIRSKETANDIRALIIDTNKKVEHGNNLSQQADSMFNKVQEAISDIEEKIKHIDSNGQQQQSGIQNINNRIDHIEELTLTNQSLSEQISRSLSTIRDDANVMKEDASFFKCDDENETNTQ